MEDLNDIFKEPEEGQGVVIGNCRWHFRDGRASCVYIGEDKPKEECYICKALEESGKYNMHGAWTELEISKNEEGKHTIYAYGEGIAEIPCHYCPNCGRKLEGKNENL